MTALLYGGMRYGYGFRFDKTYILVLIGVILSLWASAKVQLTFKKYEKVGSRSGMTGHQAAARILELSGIHNVRIERVNGNLTDHYDSNNKVLRLSDTVYNSTSLSAIGVAAHECGHAIQDQVDYGPLRTRHRLFPIANIGSRMALPIIILGVLLGQSAMLINIGIVMFSATVLFQLVTLPVEFNASKRAVVRLEETGILHGDELNKSKKVLDAAAFTYVAAAAATILQLLRLIILFGGRGRDD